MQYEANLVYELKHLWRQKSGSNLRCFDDDGLLSLHVFVVKGYGNGVMLQSVGSQLPNRTGVFLQRVSDHFLLIQASILDGPLWFPGL